MSRCCSIKGIRTDSDEKVLLRSFFNLYSINEIWFKTVGATSYGYTSSVILPHKKESKINDLFQQIVEGFKHNLVRALEWSVRKEIKHWNNATFYSHKDFKIGEAIRKKNKGKRLRDFPLEEIARLFSLKCWEPEYGGSRWAKATKLLVRLKASKMLRDDIFLIDQILDLQHNTGHILNKTGFTCLSERRCYRQPSAGQKRFVGWALAFRNRAKLEEMVKFASNEVRRVFMANKRWIEQNAA